MAGSMKKSTLLLITTSAAFLAAGRLVAGLGGTLFTLAGAIQATAALISALPGKKGGKKD